mmetsp:Transcript_1853/g.4907  ORF Transcript_1853/g.4907 Transcript_1853/m.4907 type:complete len:255 (-) Transcript_1853:43-807(-)
MRHCRHGQVPGGSRVDRPLQLREQRGQHRLGATAQEFQREPKAPRLRQRSQHRHHKHGLAQRCAAALCAVLCRARVHQPTCLQRREDVLERVDADLHFKQLLQAVWSHQPQVAILCIQAGAVASPLPVEVAACGGRLAGLLGPQRHGGGGNRLLLAAGGCAIVIVPPAWQHCLMLDSLGSTDRPQMGDRYHVLKCLIVDILTHCSLLGLIHNLSLPVVVNRASKLLRLLRRCRGGRGSHHFGRPTTKRKPRSLQ